MWLYDSFVMCSWLKVIFTEVLLFAQISIDGFLPKPGSELNSTSSYTPDKTFIFVNSRPVHHKEILKVKEPPHTNLPTLLKFVYEC